VLLNYKKVNWIYNASLPKEVRKITERTALRRKKIFSVFKDESFSINLIHKRFKVPYSTAKTDVEALKESGQVIDLGKGRVKRAIGVGL